jgi:hypothetical protein
MKLPRFSAYLFFFFLNLRIIPFTRCKEGYVLPPCDRLLERVPQLGFRREVLGEAVLLGFRVLRCFLTYIYFVVSRWLYCHACSARSVRYLSLTDGSCPDNYSCDVLNRVLLSFFFLFDTM